MNFHCKCIWIDGGPSSHKLFTCSSLMDDFSSPEHLSKKNLTQRTFSLLNFICSGIFVDSLFCRHLSVDESRDCLTCASKALDVDTVEALLEVLGVGMCIIHLRW
jgi:hypothetical protein